jgi:hypothetical protein
VIEKIYNVKLNSRIYPPSRTMCQGPVSQVSQAAGYGSKNMDTARCPIVVHGWGVTQLMLGMVPPILAEKEGPAT